MRKMYFISRYTSKISSTGAMHIYPISRSSGVKIVGFLLCKDSFISMLHSIEKIITIKVTSIKLFAGGFVDDSFA